MGRHAVLLLEGADQVGGRKLRSLADLFQVQGLGTVLADELRGPLKLVVVLPG